VSYAKASNSMSPISTLTTKLGSEYMVSCRHPRRALGGAGPVKRCWRGDRCRSSSVAEAQSRVEC
jgi:hypothetical protein